MSNTRSSSSRSRKGLTRWILVSAAVALTALVSSRAGVAQPSRSSIESRPVVLAQASSLSAPDQAGSAGTEDPYVSFERSRQARHVTLTAPRQLFEARQRWLGARADQAPAKRSGRAAKPAVAVGTNVDAPQTAYQGELAIAVDPNNSQQLVGGANTWFADTNCPVPVGGNGGTQTLYGSTDGGATWTVGCAPWPSTLNQGKQNTSFGSDPAVAWDSAGNAYVAYLLVNINCSGAGCSDTSATGAVAVAKSTDSGKTWKALGTPVNNLGNTAVFDDKEMIAVDTTSGGAHSHAGRIYVIWDEINNSTFAQIERVAFSDNGTSWTVVPLESGSASDIGGDVAIGPDGTVYAIWNRLIFDQSGQSGETTMFAKSTDGGSTWTAPTQIASHNLFSFGGNNFPPAQDFRGINAFGAIAADRGPTSPNKGNLYVVYNDLLPNAQTNDTDIFFIRSTDGGANWSAPIKVNDDNTTMSQFFPWVDVDQSSGNIAVSWYDARNDSFNKKTQIFAAFSNTGGASFQPNFQVSQNSTQFTNSSVNFSDESSADNANFNPNQYGDYAQIAFLNGVAHPMWCDSRNFFPSNTSNLLAEDAASAQVTFGTGPTPTPTATSTSSATPTATPTTTATATPTSSPTPVSAKLALTPRKRATFPPQITLGGKGGQNQTAVSVVLSNPGTGRTMSSVPIQIESVQISGGEFKFFPGTPANPCVGPINPGGNCSIPMAFSPSGTRLRKGTLTIVDNTTAHTHTIQLKGVGIPGKLSYGPRALKFSGTVGTPTATQPITLSNDNPVAMSLGTIAADNPDFIIGGTCSSALPANGSCELEVSFKASRHGREKGTIKIPDDAFGAPHKVKLAGTGN